MVTANRLRRGLIEEGTALKAVRARIEAGIKSGTSLWRAVAQWLHPARRLHKRTLHNIIQRRAEQMLLARGLRADYPAEQTETRLNSGADNLYHGRSGVLKNTMDRVVAADQQ
jgi:hypothetical protein